MAQAVRTLPGPAAWVAAAAVAAVVLTAGVMLRVAGPTDFPGVQNFLLVFSALLVEAIPFVLLGATVSAAIEVFVPSSVFDRLARLPGPMQLPASGLAGVAFPVCECGSVPVARRLVSKGLSPAAAVTFMLAAPILNPIVLLSTAIAYRGRDVMAEMVVGRAALGLVAAIAVGWAVGRQPGNELLRTRPEHSAQHEHRHDARAASFFGHLTADFVFMARFLVVGAAVAAAMQTLVPQSIVGAVAGTPIVSLLAMMGLAFVLSLCSESDAFVAASFVQFGPAAQLAFLVFGPMVDTKLGFLYTASFSRGFFITVVVIVAAVTLVGGLWLEVLLG